jgi:type IV secretory pathway TrbD component
MQSEEHIRLGPTAQRARIDWRARAYTLSFWSDAGAEKEALLSGLVDFLLPQKYFVRIDTGWSRWDLDVARGLWSRARIVVCAENHGGMKRLLRVRCAMRLSSLARFLLRLWAALTAGALILGSPLAAAILCGLGLVNLGVALWQLASFGRLMHRIIATVARSAELVPTEPIEHAAPILGAPHAA